MLLQSLQRKQYPSIETGSVRIQVKQGTHPLTKKLLDHAPMMPPPTHDYTTGLQDVKARIQVARIAVAWAVNRQLILLYWDLGRGIVEKQERLEWD